MIRRLLLTLGLLVAPLLPLRSQDSLATYAKVLSHSETFLLTSPTSGEWTVDQSIVVTNPKGRSAAALLIYTDSFRRLTSFSGEITPLGGGKVVKLKQKDLVYYSLSEGLADDSASWGYLPDGPCPLLVHYTYKVTYRNGIASFPTFLPVTDEKVSVTKASYTVDVPDGFAIKHLSGGMDYACESKDGRERHRWTLKDFGGYAEEESMPSVFELIPYVYASPVSIDYGGYSGTQSDWKEIGSWLAQLQEGRQELDPQQVAKLQEMCRDCTTDLQKLQVLYRYLRNTTRYVSLQFGIGGLQPMAAAEVHRMGFGDCKGLSNYLRAMLAAVGVASDYTIIHSRRANLLPGYASLEQMNHVMLAVPLPEIGDTAWVECTNPLYPLGYRHSGAAGHQVVLVHADGGEQIRIPDYPDSLSREVQHTQVSLSPDGSARLTLRRELFLDHVEPYLDFRNLKPDVRRSILTRGMKLQADELNVTGVTDNFDIYATEGRGFVPEMTIDYTMSTRLYANLSGDRMFVPLNPVAQMLSSQKGKRINDLVFKGSSVYEDHITLPIPEGWHVESLPKGEKLETVWGQFSSTASAENGVIEIRQVIRLLPGRTPAAEYDGYRAFARVVNKCYAATLVLKKDGD